MIKKLKKEVVKENGVTKLKGKIKAIDIKEFRELGFLQELNRQFLHPLGLAIEVIIDDKTGVESLGRVWDFRDDPEGLNYALNNPKYTSKERLESFRKKADYVINHELDRMQTRVERLGFHIEPIPEEIDFIKN